MRVQDDGDGGVAAALRVIAAFEPALGAGKDNLVYDWAIEAGCTDTSPAARLPKVPMKAGRPRPAPERAYSAALRSADPRELLALRLAAEVGLRRAEVTKIHSDDLFEDEGGVSLLVHGKGDRDRTVPLPKSLGEALTALPYGYAFPGKDHGHLSPRYLGKLIARLLPDTLTMHTLRHRFATRLYARRRDILMVQQALGHASVGTTQRYVDYDRNTMREAIDEMAGTAEG